METVSAMVKVEEGDVLRSLQEAGEKLDSADGELILDFSGLRRIEPRALSAMEELAGAADRRAIRLVLRGVNVDLYKVLKLLQVGSRFSYVD